MTLNEDVSRRGEYLVLDVPRFGLLRNRHADVSNRMLRCIDDWLHAMRWLEAGASEKMCLKIRLKYERRIHEAQVIQDIPTGLGFCDVGSNSLVDETRTMAFQR
jgi:hypothetical protein